MITEKRATRGAGHESEIAEPIYPERHNEAHVAAVAALVAVGFEVE